MSETGISVPTSVYEGAGFILYRSSVDENGKKVYHFILGERQKKPADELKDPTQELECPFGKNDENETPHITAERECNEEVGCAVDSNGNLISVLDVDWQTRATPLLTFQPFSKKWIWSFLLKVSDAEFSRLQAQDAALTKWDPAEKRDFCAVTGCSELSRKALKGLYLTPADAFISNISTFAASPATANRMKDAKAFGATAKKFVSHRLTDQQQVDYPLRGFNLVVFEKNAAAIAKVIE